MIKASSRALNRKELEQRPLVSLAAEPAVTSPTVAYALYVDGSQSMAGFVGCRVDPTEFDEIVDRLAVDLGVTELTRFGASTDGQQLLRKSAIDATVHCPAFYDRAQNPDARLFQGFLEDSSGQIGLYVTDGVQSDLSATQSPSVNVLREWLRRGRPLALLSFRSKFTGRGWSEARKTWAGEWRVPDRPFYVYVFARTDAQLDRTLGRLSGDLRGKATVIRFGDAAARCTPAFASIPRGASDADPPWLLLTASTTARVTRQLTPVIEVDCALLPGSPLARLHFSADTVKYGRWTGQAFTFPTIPPSGTVFRGDSTVTSKAGFRTIVSVQLADDASTRFGYFAVQLAPARIELSDAVRALSTNSDAALASAGQTYRFDWVLEQLLRAQLERALPRVDFFLTATFR